MKKLTKEQRKDLAWEKYLKVQEPAWKKYEKVNEPAWEKYLKVKEPAWEKYEKECEEIDKEPKEIPEIIEQNGIKYKRIEE